MQALGTVWIGKYRVWITSANPFDRTQAKQPYYDVLLTYEENQDRHYYINLMKEGSFGSFRSLFDVDDRDRPTLKTDQVQYQAYLDRKQMEQPMWKLSDASVHLLFRHLFFAWGEAD